MRFIGENNAPWKLVQGSQRCRNHIQKLGASVIFACVNRTGRCRWLAGFLGDVPFPPPFHSGAAPYSHRFTLIGSQDLDVKNRPNLFTHSRTKIDKRRIIWRTHCVNAVGMQNVPDIAMKYTYGTCNGSSTRRRFFSTYLPYKAEAYTRQKAQSKYRNRMLLEIASQKQSSDTHKTAYDRVKRCRERKINIKACERVNVDVFTQNKRQCPQHSQPNFFFTRHLTRLLCRTMFNTAHTALTVGVSIDLVIGSCIPLDAAGSLIAGFPVYALGPVAPLQSQQILAHAAHQPGGGSWLHIIEKSPDSRHQLIPTDKRVAAASGATQNPSLQLQTLDSLKEPDAGAWDGATKPAVLWMSEACHTTYLILYLPRRLACLRGTFPLSADEARFLFIFIAVPSIVLRALALRFASQHLPPRGLNDSPHAPPSLLTALRRPLFSRWGKTFLSGGTI
ncbi:hypothetical protein PR048_015522 [Dryococelus australis]|uniref:Uncharacterized protein n=1 Tax=Dryococelus australis TaxID=614101 RepID=A0ABQ9HH68_9NEOP|nr:hypothetical protein PR048_015522 [Dryococelus australis]